MALIVLERTAIIVHRNSISICEIITEEYKFQNLLGAQLNYFLDLAFLLCTYQ